MEECTPGPCLHWFRSKRYGVRGLSGDDPAVGLPHGHPSVAHALCEVEARQHRLNTGTVPLLPTWVYTLLWGQENTGGCERGPLWISCYSSGMREDERR